MELGLEGRLALVAGGSKGLGKAAARELLLEGCTVGICGRNQDALDATVEELSEEGDVWAHRCDLVDTAQAKGFVHAGLDRHGSIDVLVTNAGGPPPGLFLDFDEAAWLEAFRLNTLSAITLIREALPSMVANGWGRIITVTSVSVKQPIDGLILSNGVRMGVVGFGKTLSREVARHGITVNNVCPGYTDTERVRQLAEKLSKDRGITPDRVRAAWEADIPVGRIGRVEEFGAVVAFLASERASYVTGASIAVDGGFVRGVG
jgi:3-oxoacyl-[acyl-carrier protein] reductase